MEHSEHAHLVPFIKQARADILDASIKDRENNKNKEQDKQSKMNRFMQQYSDILKNR